MCSHLTTTKGMICPFSIGQKGGPNCGKDKYTLSFNFDNSNNKIDIYYLDLIKLVESFLPYS